LNRASAVDIVLLIFGVILILQFLGGIGFLSFFPGIALVAPFGVVGGALILVVYYRRKNRALGKRAVSSQSTKLMILGSSISDRGVSAKKRPKAGTVLAVVPTANGLYSLAMGVISVLLTMVVFTATSEQLESFREDVFGDLGILAESQQSLQLFLSILSILLLSLGIASMIAAYGLFKGKRWAWSLAVKYAISSIIIDIVLIAFSEIYAISVEEGSEMLPVGVITGGIMLYLLSRTDVKSFLDKSHEPRVPTGNNED